MRLSPGEPPLGQLAAMLVANVTDDGNGTVAVTDNLRELAALAVDADCAVGYALVLAGSPDRWPPAQPPRWRMLCPSAVLRDHERTPAWPGPHQTLIGEHTDSPAHGVAAEPVLLHQRGERWQCPAALQLAGRDLCAQDASQLQVGRFLSAMINAHAIKVTDQALSG